MDHLKLFTVRCVLHALIVNSYIASFEDSSSLSLLEFCPYTKCWDVAQIVFEVIEEVKSLKFTSGLSSITMNSDLTVLYKMNLQYVDCQSDHFFTNKV